MSNRNRNQRGNFAGKNNQQRANSGGGGGPNNNNRGNGQYYCANHGHNSSHVTADCSQGSNKKNYNNNNSNNNNNKNKNANANANGNRNNNNNQPQGQKVTCANCGKNGHVAENCRANPSRQQQQKPPFHHVQQFLQPDTISPPPYNVNDERNAKANNSNGHHTASVLNAAQNYCPSCNEQGHNPTNCNNVTAIHEAFHSRLYCLACRTKGHLAADCNNPLSTQCTRCYRKNHNSPDCTLSPDRDAQIRRDMAASMANRRYIWNNPSFEHHHSQRAEMAYEEAKKNAALNGVALSQEDRVRYEKNIYLSKQIFGPDSFTATAAHLGANMQLDVDFTPKPDIPAPYEHRVPQQQQQGFHQPQHGFKPSTRPNVTTRSNHAANNNAVAAAKQAKYNEQKAELDQLRRNGVNLEYIKMLEHMLHSENLKEQTEIDKEVTKKINSALGYHVTLANDWLRQNEGLICTKAEIPQSRMDEIKYFMLRGGSFYRDPRAMKALFERELPRCFTCSQNGTIIDRWFNIIPPTMPKTEMLKLYDGVDWGIFVAFECRCVRQAGYGYFPTSTVLCEHLPEEER